MELQVWHFLGLFLGLGLCLGLVGGGVGLGVFGGEVGGLVGLRLPEGPGICGVGWGVGVLVVCGAAWVPDWRQGLHNQFGGACVLYGTPEHLVVWWYHDLHLGQ